MIITEYVKIKSNKFLQYYRDKGYEINSSKEEFIVHIKDLLLNSNVKISCLCDVCNKKTEISYNQYNKNILKWNMYTCSVKCAQIKTKKTNLEKYGVDNPLKNDLIKNKTKKTNLEKYGVENVFQSEIIKNKIKNSNNEKYGVDSPLKSDLIKNKTKQTNLKKYGVDNPMKNESIKNKVKNIFHNKTLQEKTDILNKRICTNIKNFGVDYTFKSELVKNKIKETNNNKWGVDYFLSTNKIKEINKKRYNKKSINDYKKIIPDDFIIVSYKENIFKLFDKRFNNEFEIPRSILYERIIKYNTEISTVLNPINKFISGREKQISVWLKELNIEFIESDREILGGKELDIYIPSKNLAIEFNGLYWHSELFKDKNYHLNKSLQSQDKGILLLHIWEDEWIFKQNIVKSIILNRLGLISNKIYARQCEVRIVEDSKTVRQFLDDNHIQGYSQSSIKLGLFKDDELVSLMTFGYRHTNAKKEFELIRFCNKINLNVVGAASKLFNYFKKNFEFNQLISYSDFRLFDGKMYETLGFTKQHLSNPDYFWCKDLERRHRFNFNKQKLIKEGYDSTKTEVEIMHERGYYRIFGCGQVKWVL